MDRPLTLKLTDEEKALLDVVDFDYTGADSVTRDRSTKAAAELFRTLDGRGAIPAARLRYFRDPFFRVGSNVSWEHAFTANASQGQDPYDHGAFMPYLEYFLHGPDLPPEVMAKFHDIGPVGARRDRQHDRCAHHAGARR